MSEDLENQLRNALRPVDPGEGFTARVLARVAEEPQRDGNAVVEGPIARRRSLLVWLPAAVAASLVAVVAVTHVWRTRQEEAGLAARDQVMEALRVTSDKLDLAYQIVNSPAPSPADDEPGV